MGPLKDAGAAEQSGVDLIKRIYVLVLITRQTVLAVQQEVMGEVSVAEKDGLLLWREKGEGGINIGSKG